MITNRLSTENTEKVRHELQAWAIALFRRSVLKQAKWNAIRKVVGNTEGKHCLDLGSDNGIMSLLLRQGGGKWRSADLDPLAVTSIRSLVGDPVEQLTGPILPYENQTFDLIVVVDLMEHLEDDIMLTKELARVLSPGGRLIVNVPHVIRHSPLRQLRLLFGLTDEQHGHLRPGYDQETLDRHFRPYFENIVFSTYVGPFSELVDIFLTWVLERKKTNSASSKGTLLTRESSQTLGTAEKIYNLMYPFIKTFSLLDNLLPFLSGHMLLASAYRKKEDLQ